MKERLNALEVALNNELREYEFYKTHARRTNNPVGKAMFDQIAAEEREHHERLKQLHARWVNDKKWPETVPLKVENTLVGDILKNVLNKVATEPAWGDADDLQAVRMAIDFEEQGAAYYARLRDIVSDAREKAFFDLMANIEHEHYVSLKETEEYFVDPAGWFMRTEKTGLDGA
jgi:rubrerythrin